MCVGGNDRLRLIVEGDINLKTRENNLYLPRNANQVD